MQINRHSSLMPLAMLCLAFCSSVTAEPLPTRFMDRLEAFQPQSGHVVVERGQQGEQFRLVTLPEGETLQDWRARFSITVMPNGEQDVITALGTLMEWVEQPYEGSCPIENRFYMLDSLSYMIDDEHTARTMLSGCSHLPTPAGPVREIHFSRLIAGPQGRFVVQWSERSAPSDSISREEEEHLRHQMDHLDPFGGHAVREAERAAADALLR